MTWPTNLRRSIGKKTLVIKPIHDFEEGILLPPVPALSLLPTWYKGMSPFLKDTPSEATFISTVGINLTIKRCVPFRDSLAAGYIIQTSADVYLEKSIEEETDKDTYKFHWASSIPMVGKHSVDQISGMPVHLNLVDDLPFKWMNPWVIQTPPGYSTYFTHPLGYPDLPFYTLTGLVDTDKHPVAVNFPFFVRRDCEGIIPRGTPIAQFFPIKRDSWKSKVLKHNAKETISSLERITQTLSNTYRDNWWVKKEFK
jgi:hypothetical protein